MGARRTLLVALAVGCAAVLLVLRAIDAHLVHPASPHGVLSLEFCGFADGCAAIRAQWDERTREWAMLSLGVDALFLLLYPALLAVALVPPDRAAGDAPPTAPPSSAAVVAAARGPPRRS